MTVIYDTSIGKGNNMKPIPGFTGYKITEDGKVYSEKSGKFLTLFLKSNRVKYMAANLYTGKVDGFKWNFRQVCVHEIVAHVYLGEKPDPKFVVAHLDGNPENNHYTNLKWCSQSENLSHRHDHGTSQYLYNKNSNERKLSDEDAIFIRQYEARFSANKMADLFEVSPGVIQNIINRKTYKDL